MSDRVLTAKEVQMMFDAIDRAKEQAEYRNYWTEKEAVAAGEVEQPRCVHGYPRNVFCPKCDG